jgi:hypothetical protein
MKLRANIATLLAVAALSAAATGAHAAATIVNTSGTVAIGVDNLGQLNTSVGSVATNSSRTGVAYNFGTKTAPNFKDATSPGCYCEGWGVSINNSLSGYANNSSGTAGLSAVSFASGANTATVVAALTAASGLTVTHQFLESVAAPNALFKVKVTIKNDTAAKVNDVKYVRVMDWDVPPTEFAEYVTIKGTGTTTLLEKSHLNGFNTSNPLGGGDSGSGFGGVDVDVTDAGPNDHGAYFRFNFGSLDIGQSYSFDIFYGAAASEAAALAAIAAEKIELFSFGQSSRGGEVNGEPATFIFGFAGVGGEPVVPVSAPGSLALAGLALLGLRASRRRKA